MERNKELVLKKLELTKIHTTVGTLDDIRRALLRLGMKDVTERDNYPSKPYVFIYPDGHFMTSGDCLLYETSILREMSEQELYSILFPEETSVSNEKWAFEGGEREAPFYMVYVEGRSCPTKKHKSFESAEAEAVRLSNAMGQKAYVLSACMEVEIKRMVQKTSIENMEPFNE